MRILIAPLDWGLGHSTRCIPIVRHLIQKGHEVVIAAEGRSKHLLLEEFPSCEFVSIGGYPISYPRNGYMALKIVLQIPKILSGIRREHEQLKKTIKEKSIGAVISDNRFGLWCREVPCVFITHQIMVKSFFGETVIHKLNKQYISKYTACWIPDREGKTNLSGDLAHRFPLPVNAKYIGVLSRFGNEPLGSTQGHKTRNHILVLLSGPEPQRTVFERKILEQLTLPLIPSLRGKKVLIVQGITERKERRIISEDVEAVSHLTSEELRKEILASEIILSRPGYSTVMDLAVLNKKAIFVPTPGQTEQEYLARYYLQKGIAYFIPQKEFDLEIAWKESVKYSGFTDKYAGEEFKKAVDAFF